MEGAGELLVGEHPVGLVGHEGVDVGEESGVVVVPVDAVVDVAGLGAHGVDQGVPGCAPVDVDVGGGLGVAGVGLGNDPQGDLGRVRVSG